jgi:hypothetical protein
MPRVDQPILPPELIVSILIDAHLNPPELLRLRTVNKQMADLVTTDALWGHYSPSRSSGGRSLFEAFMDRRQRGTLVANERLRKAYELSSEEAHNELKGRSEAPTVYFDRDEPDHCAALISRLEGRISKKKLSRFGSFIFESPVLMRRLIELEPYALLFAPSSTLSLEDILDATKLSDKLFYSLPPRLQRNEKIQDCAFTADPKVYLHMTPERRLDHDKATSYCLRTRDYEWQNVPGALFDQGLLDSTVFFENQMGDKEMALHYYNLEKTHDIPFMKKVYSIIPFLITETQEGSHLSCNRPMCLLRFIREKPNLFNNNLAFLQEVLPMALNHVRPNFVEQIKRLQSPAKRGPTARKFFSFT